MTTLQEQFEKDFPDKRKEEVSTYARFEDNNFTNYDLDLRGYVNLTSLVLKEEKLTSLNLSEQKNLIRLRLAGNNLTSVDFLNTLPNPEKLEVLEIYDNNIQPTTLDFLRPFVNLRDCKLGENSNKNKEILQRRLQTGTYNKFYGSLKSIKNLTKLEKFCIAGTDVDSGIEYVPVSILQEQKQAKAKKDLTQERYESYLKILKDYEPTYQTKLARGEISDEVKKKREERVKEFSTYERWFKKESFELLVKGNLIDCQPLREDAKVKKIQEQLRPLNYDLEVWQLTNLDLMIKVWGEQNKDKARQAIASKIQEAKQELDQVKAQESKKTAKISRLETKLQRLEETKTRLEIELAQEKQARNTSRQSHKGQLKALATILFPSNSDIRNINFADLKRQAEKVKQENNENKEKIKNLDNQLFLKEVEIENLKSEKKGLEQKLTEIDQKSLAKELEQLKNALQNKLDKENYEDLDNLLEAQIEFAKSSNSYAQRQITKIQQKLLKTGKMNEEELQNLSQIQDKLTKLETQLEAKIEINC